MPPTPRTTDRYTYADTLRWPDDERWELIDGEAYAMTPVPTPTHQTIVAELVGQLVAHFRDKPCRVFPAPFDVRLPRAGEADDQVDTVVQPDIAETRGATSPALFPDLAVDWGLVFAKIPAE